LGAARRCGRRRIHPLRHHPRLDTRAGPAAEGAGTRPPLAQRLLPYALPLLGAVSAILPMVWMVSASLMPAGAANSYPPRLFPETVTFEHYRALFTRLNLGRYLLNSTFIAVVVTTISLLINSMAGYAFAKL